MRLVDGKTNECEVPDPMSFRIPASDSKGHTARLWFKVQPAVASQLDKVVASKAYPYRTKGDILRHALHRHLKWVVQHEGVPSVMSQVDAILEIVRDEEMSAELDHVMSKAGERINYYLGMGAVGEARKLLLRIQGHIEHMPDGYWKDRYGKELKTRYGHVLDSAPKASLKKGDHRDD